MKKCPDCSREVDKMAIVCEYCGRLEKELQKESKNPKPAPPQKTLSSKKEKRKSK